MHFAGHQTRPTSRTPVMQEVENQRLELDASRSSVSISQRKSIDTQSSKSTLIGNLMEGGLSWHIRNRNVPDKDGKQYASDRKRCLRSQAAMTTEGALRWGRTAGLVV